MLSISPYSVSALLMNVRSAARRLVNEPADVLTKPNLGFEDIVLDAGRVDVYYSGNPIGLTPIQFTLLYFLAEHSDRYFTTKELIKTLWGRDYVAGDKHVSVRVSEIRRKMRAAAPNVQLIETRAAVGYRFIVPDQQPQPPRAGSD